MPGTPATSPNFGAPRFDNNDDFDFAGDVNSVVDTFDLKAALKAMLPPIGSQLMYAGTSDPAAIDGIAAYLICDGRFVDQADYPEAFAVIGHRYNRDAGGAIVDPANGTFRLPDKRGRASVGAGTATGAPGATAKTQGVRAGEETHVLTPGEGPLRSHTHGGIPAATGIVQGTGVQTFLNAGSQVNSTGDVNGGQQNGSAHNNLQPYEVDNFIIRVL